jgi:phosphatidylglycerophosphatase A
MTAWVKILATFFGIGCLPFAPGTWASLAGLAIAWVFYPFIFYGVFVLTAVGLFISKPAEEIFKKKDPSEFVWDEAAGMALSVLWLPKAWEIFLSAFIIFRLLDILKPWPINLIQKSKSPESIMWDDLAAGLVTNLLIRGFLELQKFQA